MKISKLLYFKNIRFSFLSKIIFISLLSLSFSSEYPKSIKENLQNEKNKYEINYLFFAIVLGYSLTYGMFGCYSLLHLDDRSYFRFICLYT